MTTVRYFCTIFVRLIEEIFSHVSTKFHCKILKTSKVMNFLRKISKFKINEAYKGNHRYSKLFVLHYVVALKRANCYMMIVNANYYESWCSKCLPSALMHACSLFFLNARTAFFNGLSVASRSRYLRARFSVLSYMSASVCRLDISQA